jgi:hypothetical protein
MNFFRNILSGENKVKAEVSSSSENHEASQMLAARSCDQKGFVPEQDVKLNPDDLCKSIECSRKMISDICADVGDLLTEVPILVGEMHALAEDIYTYKEDEQKQFRGAV